MRHIGEGERIRGRPGGQRKILFISKCLKDIKENVTVTTRQMGSKIFSCREKKALKRGHLDLNDRLVSHEKSSCLAIVQRCQGQEEIVARECGLARAETNEARNLARSVDHSEAFITFKQSRKQDVLLYYNICIIGCLGSCSQ